MPDGLIRGLPKRNAQPEVIPVAAQTGSGTAPAFSVADILDGDFMVCFGAVRNGTVTGPSSAGWTTDYSVDESSGEWNKVFSKVADGESDFTFAISNASAAGFVAFRGEGDLKVAQRHLGHDESNLLLPPILVPAASAYLGIYISAAFGGRETDQQATTLNELGYLYNSDEMVIFGWQPVTSYQAVGPYIPRNATDEGKYGSWHSYSISSP